jgi:hypothetical protein
MTTEEIRQRAIDLRKIYGIKGVSDLLNVDPSIVNAVLTSADERAVSRVKGNVRHYWKAWMRGLTKDSRVVIVDGTKDKGQIK